MACRGTSERLGNIINLFYQFMKVFALSDIHIDFDINKQWIAGLSVHNYQEDVLILAGDITDSLSMLEWCLKTLARRFKKVLYVPGNHELWIRRDTTTQDSFEKFRLVRTLAEDIGVSMQPYHADTLSIVPLLSWYDYSFGEPGNDLLEAWMDYFVCRWPDGVGVNEITSYFLQQNEPLLSVSNNTVISFSHFLPRIDVMPIFIPPNRRYIYPVLGTSRLDAQIRQLQSSIHVYGHSHVNRKVELDGITYINNAFGYPQETRITSKSLLCIYELNMRSHSER